MPNLIGSESKDVAYSSAFSVPADCTYVVACVAKTSAVAPPTITLGGVTLPVEIGRDNGDSVYVTLHTLASPPTGSQTLAISAASQDYRVTLVYLKQVDTGSPVVASADVGGYFGTAISYDCTSVANALVIDLATYQNAGTVTAGSGQTALDTTSFSSGNRMRGVSYESASGTTTNIAWTASVAGPVGAVAIAVRDGGSPATAPRGLVNGATLTSLVNGGLVR